jgi:thiol-disulfide isomerase/thioredoxin
MGRMMTVAALALAIGAGCDSLGDEGDASAFPVEGTAYPAVTIEACDGSAFDVGAYIADHEVTFITYGAKWCTACQKEAPIINADLVDGLADEDVGVVQILVENDPGDPPPRTLCAAWRDDLEARFEVVIDPEQKTLPQHFGTAIDTLPLHYIVTRDQTVRLRRLGELPPDIKARVEAWIVR